MKKIQGYIPQKQKEITPNLGGSIDSVILAVNEIKTTKQNVERTLDTKIKEVEATVEGAMKVFDDKTKLIDNKVAEFEETAINLIQDIHNIPQIKGDKGDDADEEAMEERLLAKIPKLEQIVKSIPKIDEEKLVKKVLKAIPENKASLKVIRETLKADPLEVATQIKSLPDFSIKTSQVDGLDKLLKNIQLSGKGYVHGGGFNNIYSSSTLVSNGLTGLNFTGTGVSSVTKNATTGIITVDITGGGGTPGGSDTQLQYNNAGAFGGISGATTNGTAVTFATDGLLVTNIKASSSAGILLESNNGTDVLTLGAGGGSNATFAGGVNITGDLAVDTNVLYVDTTNNRVGIGTTSPSVPLEIANSSASDIQASSTAGSMGLTFKSTLGGTFTWKYWFDRVNTLGLKWDYNGSTMMSLSQTGALTIAGALAFNGNLSLGSNSITGNLSSSITPYDSVTGNMILKATTFSTAISKIKFQTGTSSADRVIIDGDGIVTLGSTAGTTARLIVTDTALSGSGSLSGGALLITQTWNTTGTPTAIKLNVTDTASNASSLLMDLQVGGTSKFKVTKGGAVSVASGFPLFWGGNSGYTSITGNGNSSGSSLSYIDFRVGDGSAIFRMAGNGMLSIAGSTSSYPGVKRNGTGIDVKLADDSAYTSLVALTLKATQAGGYISSDGSTGATGTFTTADAKTVTVKDGLITNII